MEYITLVRLREIIKIFKLKTGMIRAQPLLDPTNAYLHLVRFFEIRISMYLRKNRGFPAYTIRGEVLLVWVGQLRDPVQECLVTKD